MKYEKVQIGDIVTLRQGFAINKNTKHHMSEVPTNLHLLRIGDMKDNHFQIFVKDTIPKQFIADYNDIIYTRTGQVGLVFRNQYGVIHNNCFTVSPKDDSILCRDFLFYVLQTKEFYDEANSKASGAAQLDLSHGAFNSIFIPLPPTKSQINIANILSTYDNLIENNRKQIKLLEEAAQRLYKEWFVDLRFPGHENVKIVDGVPEGWKKTTLGDICSLSKEVQKKDNNTYPYIGLEHMPRNNICLSEWGDSSEISSNKFKYAENDILFGKIRPYFHKVGFALNNGVASTDIIIIKPIENMWSILLLTVSSKDFVNYSYKTCKEGAKMPRADWDKMLIYDILIPNNELLDIFNNQIWLMTRKIKTLALQSRSLARARDMLLPRLMSGEVEV